MVELNPLGILLAAIFASSMAFLFFWMFRVPPALPLPAAKVHRSVEAIHKILVPIGEAITSERAVELACRLGNGKKADLVLVHIIVVPHVLPLDAPMPEREKIAQDALELGCTIAQRYGIHARARIVRHRSATEGILRIADQEKVDAILLGVGIKSRVPGEWGKTSEEILRRANCEVLIDKVPMTAQPVGLPA
ncbi:MAG: universal stress protein [Chloroflexota bacterium]|nr:universal stress protein [Chloroflexota bacterium]